MVCSACLPPVAGSEAAVEQVGRYTRRQSGVVREIQVNGTRRRTEPASLAVWMALAGPLEYGKVRYSNKTDFGR